MRLLYCKMVKIYQIAMENQANPQVKESLRHKIPKPKREPKPNTIK